MRARAPLIIAILIVLATFACYGRVIGQHFVSYDDNGYVTDNAHVKAGLTLRGAAWAFTNHTNANWHPLTWLSHMADCQLYGLNASGHKLTNVLIHAANAVLLFLVLLRMTGCTWRSTVVAALFALHPLHVESVAWVAERKDVLSTFFGFWALWAYAGYARHPNWRRYGAVAACMALSLLAKPTWVTLPFLLLLLDYWPLQRWPRSFAIGEWHGQRSDSDREVGRVAEPGHGRLRVKTRSAGRAIPFSPSLSFLIVEKIPLLALTLASSIVTYFVQKAGGAVASFEHIPLHARIINAMMTYVAYLGHMIWPLHLAFFYPRQESWPIFLILLAAMFLAAVTALALSWARRLPALAVGWFWYLGMLVPTIGLVQVGDQAMADRYTYVPLIGIFLAIIWAIPQRLLDNPVRRAAGIAAALIILAALSFQTWNQVGYWQDDTSLCLHALAAVLNNYVAEINYGGVLLTNGQGTDALEHFQNAVRMRPDFRLAHYDKARALAALHLYSAALDEFRFAWKLKTTGTDAPAQIARILQAQGKPQEALAALQAGARADPRNINVLIPLGMTLASHQQPEAAADIFAASLPSTPTRFPYAHQSGHRPGPLGPAARSVEGISSGHRRPAPRAFVPPERRQCPDRAQRSHSRRSGGIRGGAARRRIDSDGAWPNGVATVRIRPPKMKRPQSIWRRRHVVWTTETRCCTKSWVKCWKNKAFYRMPKASSPKRCASNLIWPRPGKTWNGCGGRPIEGRSWRDG